MRLANAPRLPFEFVGLADNVSLYLSEIETLADTMREETLANNARIDSGVYALALDPTRSLVAPLKKAEVPHFNFAPLKNALAELEQAAQEYAEHSRGERLHRAGEQAPLHQRARAHRDDGLPGRPWFRHLSMLPAFIRAMV